MIYDGIITKPPLEEVVEHGWLKDQAAKVHKYIERHRGKNGKWIYKYKRASMPKMMNIAYKNRNNLLEGDEKISRYLENRGYMSMDDYVKNHFRRNGSFKLLKSLSKARGLDIDKIMPPPRQNNRGYTNSGSSSAKLSLKYSKVKATHFPTPFEKEIDRKRKIFETTKRFNEHMAAKRQLDFEKKYKKIKREMEKQKSDFEKEYKDRR